MAETASFDVDSINDRIRTLLDSPFETRGKSMAALKEAIAFIDDLAAMNKSGMFTLTADEGRELVDIYASAKDEYGNRRRVEEATGQSWAKLQMTLDTC